MHMQADEPVPPADAGMARQQAAADRVAQLSRLLDSAFRIPGTRWRVGWDVLLGLVPVAGDALSMTLSGYVIWLARRAGAPSRLRMRMLGNVAVDFLVGLVPGIGDLLDIANRANLRNVRLLDNWLQAEAAKRAVPAPERGLRAELLMVLLLVAVAAGLAWWWYAYG